MSITSRFLSLRASIPAHITMVLAVKHRSVQELQAVIESGATDLGYNYVQEAVEKMNALGAMRHQVRWHLIGALQKNKINKALDLFDCIQTIDSIEKADQIHLRAERNQKPIRCLIEINSGQEHAKSGVDPDFEILKPLCEFISQKPFFHCEGLMTMGPFMDDAEANRPYFKMTKQLLDQISAVNIPGISMKTLSMGMSHSYEVAIEEGATMIRPGTLIFGPRH